MTLWKRRIVEKSSITRHEIEVKMFLEGIQSPPVMTTLSCLFLDQIMSLKKVLERCKHKLHQGTQPPSEVKVSAMAKNASARLRSFLRAIHIHEDLTKELGLLLDVQVPALLDLLTVLCNQPAMRAYERQTFSTKKKRFKSVLDPDVGNSSRPLRKKSRATFSILYVAISHGINAGFAHSNER